MSLYLYLQCLLRRRETSPLLLIDRRYLDTGDERDAQCGYAAAGMPAAIAVMEGSGFWCWVAGSTYTHAGPGD